MQNPSVVHKIERAFDRAVGYEPPAPDPAEQTAAARRRRKGKGKARAIVPDDEEDDPVEMAQVASVGGGFLPDPSDAPSQAEPAARGGGGGGGFLPEPSDNDSGGGFLVDADPGTFSGGFMPMETDSIDYTSSGGGGGGGGFLPDDSQFPEPTSLPPNTFGGGGGFLLPTTNFDAFTPSSFDPTMTGGFLPQLPDLNFDVDSLALPTPPRPARIPLSRLPGALRDLGVPRGSEKEVMEMFGEVASDDEDVEGGKSVRRERFIEALEVLLAGDDGEDDENDSNEDEYRDGQEDEELRSPPARRRSTRTTRQSTRANPVQSPGEDTGGKSGDDHENLGDGEVKEMDFAQADELSSESEDSAEPSTDDDDDGDEGKKRDNKGSKSRKATSTKTKNKRHKYDPRARVSKDKIAAASDSFDLFFEGSPQLSLPQGNRAIGLAELQRACRVLKEKLSDQDLIEMLEFAAEGKGLVDLESFARVLIETRL
ncbi:hypothetical protein JCM11491_006854 [Sporobolomyces phaffii]